MRPLRIDFAEPRRRPTWLWYVVAVALLAIAGERGWSAWRLKEEVVTLDAQVQRQRVFRDETKRHAQLPATPAAAAPYIVDAAAIVKAAEFPIDTVLATLESVQVAGVRVTSLDVSTGEGITTVELECSDLAVLMRYVNRLNADGARWRLVQAQAGASGTPVRAVLSAVWL